MKRIALQESKNDKIIEKMLKDPLFKTTKDGKIYSKWTENGQGISDKWREVGNPKSDGYLRFRYKDNFLLSHRVIYRKYKGPLHPNKVVNHKNKDKNDLRPANLELISQSDNNFHKWKDKKSYIVSRVMTKLGYFDSKWVAPDGKIFPASKAGHQDWIDTHEDFLVDKGYLKKEEIDNSSIDYMIYKKDWIRALDQMLHFNGTSDRVLKRVEKAIKDLNMKKFELWPENHESLGDYTIYDLERAGSLKKLLKENRVI